MRRGRPVTRRAGLPALDPVGRPYACRRTAAVVAAGAADPDPVELRGEHDGAVLRALEPRVHRRGGRGQRAVAPGERLATEPGVAGDEAAVHDARVDARAGR